MYNIAAATLSDEDDGASQETPQILNLKQQRGAEHEKQQPTASQQDSAVG